MNLQNASYPAHLDKLGIMYNENGDSWAILNILDRMRPKIK